MWIWLKRYRIILKGSLADPFLYFKIFSIVLLGLISFLQPEEELKINSLIEGNSDDLFVKEESILRPEPPNLILIEKNTLKGTVPPTILSPKVMAALIGAEEERKNEIIEYTVEPGDTLWSIADKFGISLNTLLWANDLSKNSVIRPGQKLIVLPISGVIHHVKRGDTISEIARVYKGKVDEIIAFNNLSEDGKIYIGDILIIPGGMRPPKIRYAPPQVPLASSFFICPISPPCRITQGLHWYNAVDFGEGRCGGPVFAAAGGKVLKVRYGYNNGLGNYLRILHSNGVVTSYAHLQDILVKPGQKVSQGEIIGLIGHTGRTVPPGPAGCHLHFSVHGARNPFAL